MKRVLFVAWLGLVWTATSAGAQTSPFVPPAAPAPAAVPAPPAVPAPAAVAPQAPAPARPGTVTPPQPVAAPRPASVPAPQRLPTPRNIRFEVTITDTGGSKPVTKVVSVTVADNGSSGSIRNIARLTPDTPTPFVVKPDGIVQTHAGPGSFPLNLDVRGVTGYDDGSVRASVNVEYQPYIPDAKTQPGVISASATAVFQDGRRTQILQSTDPLSDRKTTIEVTATILK